MAIHHRKQLGIVLKCPDCYSPSPENDHPPSPPNDLSFGPPHSNKYHHLSSTFIVMICVFSAAFLLVSCLMFVRRYYSNSNNSRTRNPPTFDDDHEDFVDEDHGPFLDHPIWYINTVGLQPSVIDSIAVFKYKKDEGLTDGTDCSVCLNEFQEDETLRLLPKCSHAFHIPCIDTWLRSHQNCPLCRAPIVTDTNTAHSSASEPNLNHSGPREVNPVENLRDFGEGTSEIGVRTESFGGLPSEERAVAEILKKDSRFFNVNNCDFRVLSDLTDHRAKAENELQPVRRSISMDESSASRIYAAVANIPSMELEGYSSIRLVRVKKPNSEKVGSKGGNRNSSSISRLKKSGSVGCSLQMGHVAMKRSFSSSGNFTSPRRYSRSQDSMLPL